jgi:hypothetical protein
MGTHRLGHLAVYDPENFAATEALTDQDIEPFRELAELDNVEITFDPADGEVAALSTLSGDQRTATATKSPIQSGEDSPVIAFYCLDHALDKEVLWFFQTMDDDARARFRTEHNEFVFS